MWSTGNLLRAIGGVFVAAVITVALINTLGQSNIPVRLTGQGGGFCETSADCPEPGPCVDGFRDEYTCQTELNVCESSPMECTSCTEDTECDHLGGIGTCLSDPENGTSVQGICGDDNVCTTQPDSCPTGGGLCDNGETEACHQCDGVPETGSCEEVDGTCRLSDDADPGALCGDGVLNNFVSEECDDGGTTPGDGCDADCAVESGWTCDSVPWCFTGGGSTCTEDATCGNGSQEGAEECDDNNTDDGDGCSSMCVNEFCGDGATNNNGEECDDFNMDDGDGCSASCITEYCGDGTVNNNGEECDDGNTDDGDGCSSSCTDEGVAECGNGIIEAGEACDSEVCCDGITCQYASEETTCRNAAGTCDVAESCTGVDAECPTDDFVTAGTECRADAGVCDVAEVCTGSDAACPTDDFEENTVECRAAAGVCDSAENCTGSAAACPADAKQAAGTECRATAGICDIAETCDGSSNTCPSDAFEEETVECRAEASECDIADNCPGDGVMCTADLHDCLRCGNGVTEPENDGEECDDANGSNTDACTMVCADAECGDGYIWAGTEECDDGGTTNGNGCSASCAEEPGYDCTGSPSNCVTTCGDGIKAGSEACDDGDTTSGDGCTNLCALEVGWTCSSATPNVCSTSCGDGVTAGAEQCDDTNNTDGDGCSSACELEGCGNNIRNGAEACDGTDFSGNTCASYGMRGGTLLCTSDCAAVNTSNCTMCGDGVVQTSEGESCDDGNRKDNDGCSFFCKVEIGSPSNSNPEPQYTPIPEEEFDYPPDYFPPDGSRLGSCCDTQLGVYNPKYPIPYNACSSYSLLWAWYYDKNLVMARTSCPVCTKDPATGAIKCSGT